MVSSLDNKRVWVSGHRGMVGSSLIRRLEHENCKIITATKSELDLRNSNEVDKWFQDNLPEIVIIASAKVGGILANDTMPADFIYDNISIATNVIHCSYKYNVEKLLNLGSSCIYPRLSPQPIPETALLTGPLEPTNEWYAIAKISAIKLCQAYRKQHGCNFISAMPTNLYGPGDNYDLNTSHVVPALIRKIYSSHTENLSTVDVWGTGNPLREFMYVDDLADACIFLIDNYAEFEHINVGSGEEVTIRQLALTISEIIGYKGKIIFDSTKPDGTPRKLMDSSRIHQLGWSANHSLKEGLEKAIAEYTSKLQ
ncbi:GDP-L-fucose synthase family protein [uncultured Methylobacterium sp.]|uniref:GDP-L-fucose synthase family protein n=1 Tax=uncultured Methylobacterium sp. TaxID=157278 RepID=UPI0035C9AA70